jgi:hypothetical protein
MLMGGGQAFTGVSGESYSAPGGDLIEVGSGDVRLALMNGWVQPDDPPGGTWLGENHPDMLAVKIKDMESRIAALEALVKPNSVAA